MKKLLIIFLVLSAFLSGCKYDDQKEAEKAAEMKTVGTFKEVKVVEKKHIDNGKRVDDFFIIVEKNNQKVQLRTKGEESFNALQVDNIITVDYNNDFYINKIIFEKMEENK